MSASPLLACPGKKGFGVLLAFLAAACGGGEGTPGVLVRTEADSAGIRIIEYGDVTGAESLIRVLPDPVYRVGWESGDPEWGRITAGTILSDGGVAIADGTTSEIFVLGPDGSVEAVMGGRGEGPGEFTYIFGLVAVGEDTIVVQEAQSSRTTMLHAGELLRVLPPSDLFQFRMAQTYDGAGGLLLGGMPNVIALGFEEPWLRVPLFRLDLQTGAIDTVATADVLQNREITGGNPFAAGGWSTAWERGFVIGRGDRSELTWLDGEGEVVQILRWNARERPLTDDVWDAYEAAIRARSADDDPTELNRVIAERREAARGPLPELASLTADAAGRIWMGEYAPGGPNRQTRYHVVSTEGDWLGAVDLPNEVQVLSIGSDILLGIERDALEVQAVAVYRIDGP